MRKKGKTWAEESYASTAKLVSERGSATFEGEQRAQRGEGLDPLVDPSKFEVVRQANSLLVPKGKKFVLEYGVAIPVETDFDTTGSMGGNVGVAFKVLPKVQNLLVDKSSGVLRRYHVQIATGVVQDKVDQFPYQRSQFEPDEQVFKQMGMLVPERNGGDSTEDYQLSLFALAYLTKATITQYGLKGYYFVLGDEVGRPLEKRVLEWVFGPTVMEKSFGSKPPQSLPSVKEVAKKVLENWHAFYLQVGSNSSTYKWWADLFGEDRVMLLPRTEDVAEIQACIIGLTEGVVDLQSAGSMLRNAGVDIRDAERIVRVCSDIPLGLQATYPNFDKIPALGAVFENREDIWPVGAKGSSAAKKTSAKTEKDEGKSGKKKDGKKNDWEL